MSKTKPKTKPAPAPKPISDLATRCADLAVGRYEHDADWLDHFEPVEVIDIRRDMRAALALALREIAKSSTNTTRFEIEAWANQIDPDQADLAAALEGA